jgi:hypothetical protein
MPPEPVRIGLPRRAGHAPSRIEADVDGFTVWIESPDAALEPVPEAWATAFLIPALYLRRPLAVDAPVDAIWAANIDRLIPILRREWRFPRQEVSIPRRVEVSPGASDRTRGMFFTGGVDSFHALLRTDERPDVLVNVHGFDVPLDDEARQRATEDAVRAVASERGLRTVMLKTNLRDHPLFRNTPWDASHGGALAWVGHVLSGTLQRMGIGSSQPHSATNPWGSHFRTDPLWSGRRMTFVHLDARLDRLDKIRNIAAEPIVQTHLRVCWKQTGTLSNCSRCEKCMLTMLALQEAGQLHRFPQFDGRAIVGLVRLLNTPAQNFALVLEAKRVKDGG